MYTRRGNCDEQIGRNQESKTEAEQTEGLRAGKKDVMNHLAGRTVCQRLGMYWKHVLNRKFSSCDWEKMWLVSDKEHQGEVSA